MQFKIFGGLIALSHSPEQLHLKATIEFKSFTFLMVYKFPCILLLITKLLPHTMHFNGNSSSLKILALTGFSALHLLNDSGKNVQ